jgi:hypothetical protein
MSNKTQIENQIRDFFGDTSRPASETKDALEDIAILAQELADTIEPDEDNA